MTTYYTDEHEWISVEGETATIGITSYAQEQLGDVVFVELPASGTSMTKGEEACVIESVKAASEINAPVSGEVLEANSAIEDEPGKVNEDPEGAAWFVKVKMSDASELEGYMDEAAYKAFVADQH